MPHQLSKSTFLRGSQCEKSLWLNKHRRELRDEVTASQQAVFDRGTSVGELAQQLFPGGVDASPDNYWEYDQSVALTQELIAAGREVIYEAAFIHEGVLAALDILVKEDGLWKAYEVKSAASVKDIYLTDAAVQYHVMSGAGIELADISIIHINSKYVRRGELDIQKLFTVTSILDEVLERQAGLPAQLERFKAVLTLPETPVMDIGAHCSNPYPCDFMGHCWQHMPRPSIFDLVNLRDEKAEAWYRQGIVRFEDLTEDHPLTDAQQIQVNTHLGGQPHIDRAGIRAFLDTLTYPMYFLDFESFNPAIPLYEESRPYQHIPFQYSIHYKKDPQGELRHTYFLADGRGDPRPAFIENLLSKTRLPGTILTYNQKFEIGCLKGLARDFPLYQADLEERIGRIRDLMTPFRQQLYYSPQMNGSYSIKAVLPALVPELSYENLAINEGGDASLAFEQLIYDLNADKEEIRKNLLEYCRMDTLAMVRVLEKLEAGATSSLGS